MQDPRHSLSKTQEALRTREERYRTIAENTPDVLARFDRDLRHVFINAAGASAMGLAPAAIIGRAPRELGMPAALSDQLEAVLLKTFASGQEQAIEVTFDGPRGRIHFATLVVPERDQDGVISTVLAVSRDDTAGQNAEAALRSADQRKDEFLAMLAHELRNPLAPIQNACELLARGPMRDSQTRNAIEIIRRQAHHLTRLVDDLLDVSRVTQHRIQLKRRLVEVAAVVEDAVETVAPQLHKKSHNFVSIPSYEPLYVFGDAARLVQCVVNILTNAIKYTESGGEISIRTHGDQANVFIQVSDSGTGIAPHLLPYIFDLFVQGERTLAHAEGGAWRRTGRCERFDPDARRRSLRS